MNQHGDKKESRSLNKKIRWKNTGGYQIRNNVPLMLGVYHFNIGGT
jgi:hypothetical protein